MPHFALIEVEPFVRPYAFAQYWGSDLILFHPNPRDRYKPGKPFAKLRHGVEVGDVRYALRKRRYLCHRYVTIAGETYRVFWLYRDRRNAVLSNESEVQLGRWLKGKNE